jgi:hypothetical protein
MALLGIRIWEESSMRKYWLLLVVALVLGAVMFTTAASATSKKTAGDVVTTGFFVTTETGSDRGFDIGGRGMLVRRGSGITDAYSQVLGLEANTSYGSHVHDLPCDVSAGGGHYKIDPAVAGTEEDNEIWPALATDDEGTGHGSDSVDHWARPEAQSIVVHDPKDGARIACADLTSDYDGALLTRGEFSPFASDKKRSIHGTAQMMRSHGRTFVTVRVKGLGPDTAYPAHVHDLPCNVQNGGGHYKIDPTVAGTDPKNEIWPLFTTDKNGVGLGQADVGHLARPEAQSVVVHAPDGTRIACADLKSKPKTRHTSRGHFMTTATGLERGFYLSGMARLKRDGSGRTSVRSMVWGLPMFQTFASHVHNKPCRLGGGGHYKIDPTVKETVQQNEIWPTLRATSAYARGHARVPHLARPEAQSIVIHDNDGARIACADLD